MSPAALALLATIPAFAAPGAEPTMTSPSVTSTAAGAHAAPQGDGDQQEIHPGVVAAVSAGLAASVFVVGTIAWWDRGFKPFHIYDEGVFGAGTYAGGADKCGHLFSSYVSVRAVSAIYRGLGLSRAAAGWLAIGFTGLIWNGFEVVDGVTQYGFSFGDAGFNSIGIAIGGAMSLVPKLDDLFGLRIGYVPTRDFLAHDKSPLKLINDYSGMMYYYDLKLKGIAQALGTDPGFARYLMVGMTYGTYRYSPILNRSETRRNVGAHVTVSLAEILRTFGDGDPGVEGLATFFDYYAMPFLSVALLHNANGPHEWYLNFGVANRAEIGF